MKFSELLDEYLTLREDMLSEDYHQRRCINERRNELEYLRSLLQQLDEIVEGVNRAEKPKLFVWQSPLYFKYGGLYLQVMGKRYRVVKFGKY